MATKTATPTRRRRPAATAAKKAAPAVQVPTSRDTTGYTVDLTDEGTEPTRDFGKLLEKDPSGTIQEFVDWFEGQTGHRLDVKTAQITVAAYAHFQRSPEHREVTQAKRREAAERKAQRQQAQIARLEKAAAKLEALKASAKA